LTQLLKEPFTPTVFNPLVKSIKMRWTGHVSRIGGREVHKGLWWGTLRERDLLGDPGIDGRIILRWILRNWDGDVDWLMWLKIGTGGGLL
jgi:hypothetical protein